MIWDSISDLDFYLTDGSSLTGAVVDDESYAGEGGEGYCNVYVSADSTWTVTGDSTVSSLENEGTIVDSNGKTVTFRVQTELCMYRATASTPLQLVPTATQQICLEQRQSRIRVFIQLRNRIALKLDKETLQFEDYGLDEL